MKIILYALLFTLTLSGFSYSQKYVLLDKQMSQPVSYTDKVTMEHSYKNLFPVEREKIHQFVAELEKLGADLGNPKKPLPETFDFNVGKTQFRGLKVGLAKENRMDIVLTTDCDGIKVPMHLSDAKISNANNAYFINTWVKYIKSAIK
jgi:hypothetical protein